MIKSIYSNLLPKAVLLSVFLSPGYVISKAHANTDSISGIEQTNGKLSGRVIDAKGEPIPGANISVKGTTIGTITDMDGNFSIDVNPNQILTISFIGYETKTIPVSNQKTLNVVLQETVNQLDELVVVSYGTQKKRDLTGSVSKIDAGELESFPVGQFAQKLQGQVAGVQINQSTGQPGKGMGFRIRGAASINGGSSPLFVVDGIPINMDLSSINPDEIETFSILKDAAATSLYGSRAANGVVLITTKRGKQGKTQVDVNASFGIQTLKGLKTPDVMNGEEFAQYKKEYYEDEEEYEDEYEDDEEYEDDYEEDEEYEDEYDENFEDDDQYEDDGEEFDDEYEDEYEDDEDEYDDEYEDEDDDEDESFDNEYYEDDAEEDEDCYATTCPTCEETIYFDESVLEDGEVICPNCGEKLEFDLSDLADAEDEDEE